MRINTDHKTMDMEARDINYFLQAYLLQFLFASKSEDPVEIVIPKFPAVPHPRKPGVVIPIKWIEIDSPIAADIIKDGSNIPEATVEEVRKCTRCGNPIEDGVDSNICGTCADDLRQEAEAAKSAKAYEEEAKGPSTESPARAALKKLKESKEPEIRVPKQPPGGDIGSGHPDDIGSRDKAFDRKIAADLRPEAQVDESKEKPTEIERPT